MTTNQQLSPNKQALLKIRELKQQLADAQACTGEPIAIVSMACRFPRRSRTPEEFWQCLLEQTDEVSDIPENRWDRDAFHDDDPDVPGKMYARRGVFLDDLDLMDPEFFGISPREATWVDPQQRLLMEVGWEALERAGWLPEKIGPHTGVFVGWMHNDYQNEASDSFLNLNPYIATGAAGSFLCGRLAYYLGLEGPSVAVDTACSSSLVALHLAIQSLQQRDCDRALVGGVNAICSPTTNILTCKLKALSPSGQSRAFDAAADGYLRGEGCGVVTLRRLSDAQQANDPILGIIRGSAVGHNGFSSGLTAPNPRAQTKVIRQALQRANLDPAQVAYLEAHGTGTELGDPIEMQAAAAALTENRSADRPLLVGSVKTNVGHLEAAAGMAGIIKVLLAMQHDLIPGQLNFATPNPHIPWDDIPVRVLTEATAWPENDRRIAGVSAFGMSGTNAHVVIEAPDPARRRSHAATPPSIAVSTKGVDEKTGAATPQLLVLSARNEAAIVPLADSYARRLAADPPLDLMDFAYTTSVCRSHFEQRAALVVRDRTDAIDNLKTLARAGSSDSVFMGAGRRSPKVAWQFTGQGSQFIGMSKGLYDSHPVFREAIDHCNEQLARWRNQSLVKVLFGDNDEIHHTSWTQPAIFAVQMGLAQLLESWGLRPDIVLGHSVGQYAAACVAGMMSWDDGLHLISERGRLIGELPAGGSMLAVFAPREVVEQEIQPLPEVSLAAFNGTHLVVSGPEATIKQAESRFAQRQIRTKPLTTSHAFHSALMEPILKPFERIADTVAFGRARLPLICNITGKALPADERLTGEYWASHIRHAVRFSESIETAGELGCDVILELGPQSVLTRMAAASWNRPSGSLISCLQKGVDDLESVLKAIGKLFVHGVTPNFQAMYHGKSPRRVLLPTYPFQRRRCWGPDKPRAFHAEYHSAHPLLGSKVSLAGVNNETRYEGFIDIDSPAWLPDHEVMGRVVVPGAAFVEMAIAAAGSDDIVDVVFERPLQPASRTALQTVIRSGQDHEKTIESFSSAVGSSNWTRNFTARIEATGNARPRTVDREAWERACTETALPADFYRKMLELGLNYGPRFQTIDSLRFSQDSVLTRLKTNGDIRGFTIPPTLLDGALHSLAAGLLRHDDGHLFLPVGIGRVKCYQAVENEVWCHAQWKENEGKIRTADLILFTETGQVVAEIADLKVQQVSISALRQMSGSGSERLIYELSWQNFRLPATNTKNKNWLIVHGGGKLTLAARLAANLVNKGHRVAELNLGPGARLERVDETHFTMGEPSPENWKSLFEQLSPADAPYAPDGIAWLPGSSEREMDGLDDSTKVNCTGLLNLIAILTARGQRQLECGLQIITSDGVFLANDKDLNAGQSQYWGLGRVIGAEQPGLRCRLIDVSTSEKDNPETAAAVRDILLTETRDSQLAVRGGQLYVPRMKQAAIKTKDQPPFNLGRAGSYLITGGLGMLGRQAAKWLAQNGASQIVLVSRRAPDASTQAFLGTLEETGCKVVVHLADLGSRKEMQQLFQRFDNDLLPLAGVIHAAGILDDALIGQQNWERFEKVLAPKVIGAQLLDEFTRSLDLEFFTMYSSAASVLGSPGQSNYATANAFLDGLAWQRRLGGLPATSINWGPWTEGMADDERIFKRLSLQGITPLTISEAHEAMEQILATDAIQATVIDVDWRKMRMGPGGDASSLLDGVAPARQKSAMGDSELVGQLKQLRGSAQKELLVKVIQQSLQRILSTPAAPEIDRPLIEMGLDSLMAVEFGTELQQLLGDQFAVGPTMLFDHPTIDAIANHVLELVPGDSKDQPEAITAETTETGHSPARVRDDVAIIGMSCRFPGARDVHEFWQNLLNGVDSVCEIPEDRWDIDRFYSADREPGKMYTREGGFLDDIADFDAAFFNISDQEACWIDPQHRLLLENSYRAMEDAGIAPSPLTDSNVGVFMGIMGLDYAFLPTLDDQQVINAFQGAGLSHSAGVGRISYVFGFEGPSVAVDTASSSSLVALFQAVRSLQDGNCNLALAGGVNAILAPVNSLLMSKAGLLSPDGRCKSFSAEANGFGRGEGCGVVVLKRLSDAQRDGDRIMAVVRGGAVVHNGFSSGITAPSGKSQARVISEALQDAGISPSQVQYLEAHGTGTEFGDPMELAAAASVYGKGRRPEQPLLVGSVKANISHLEAAGGISGLIKTVLALHHRVIPPQVNFDQPSPHIPWKRMPLKIVTETTPWPEAEQRFAGVTALGLVGTNAHVVLGSAPNASNDQHAGDVSAGDVEAGDVGAERTTELLVLSARDEFALRQVVENCRTFIEEQPEAELGDICFTSAAGRRHFEHRIAITAASREEAQQKLASLEAVESGVQNGKPTSNGTAGSNGKTTHALRGVAHDFASGTPKIAWVFTGERTANLDAALGLYAREPVFREMVNGFDQRLAAYSADTGRPVFCLQDWLQEPDGSSIVPSDVHLFVLQAGLAKLWRSWGIEPDVVLGFGAGQYTAACAAGGLCFNDAVILIAERENVLATLDGNAQEFNGSGFDESMLSDSVKTALNSFEALADKFNYYPANLPLICSLSGHTVPVHRSLGGSYWRQQCLARQMLTESLETLANLDCDYILELGPVGAGKPGFLETVPAKRLRSLSSDTGVATSMRDTLGQLYVAGANPNFKALYESRKRRRISMPTYPFQKRRYWITEIADCTEEKIEV